MMVLTDRERRVMTLRSTGKTWEQVALELGVTPEAARETAHDALRRMAEADQRRQGLVRRRPRSIG